LRGRRECDTKERRHCYLGYLPGSGSGRAYDHTTIRPFLSHASPRHRSSKIPPGDRSQEGADSGRPRKGSAMVKAIA
jgi:hypothetical protein